MRVIVGDRVTVKCDLQQCLYLGNLDARRDWGHACDYVEMQWLMLQQEQPEDFVIATGQQHSVRDFVNAAAAELGMGLRWQGEGVEEKAFWINGTGQEPAAEEKSGHQPQRPVVAIDARYYRPAEVDTLLGDPSRARAKLGWEPRIPFEQLVIEMAREDLRKAEREAMIQNQLSIGISCA